ncbi:MAG: sensor histidine kinase [Anaerolineae bacterium]
MVDRATDLEAAAARKGAVPVSPAQLRGLQAALASDAPTEETLRRILREMALATATNWPLFLLRAPGGDDVYTLSLVLKADGTLPARPCSGSERVFCLSDLAAGVQAACASGEPSVSARLGSLFASGTAPQRLTSLLGDPEGTVTLLVPAIAGGRPAALVLLRCQQVPDKALLEALALLGGQVAIALRQEALAALAREAEGAGAPRPPPRAAGRKPANPRQQGLRRAAVGWHADLNPERVRATIVALPLTLLQADAAALFALSEGQDEHEITAQRGLTATAARVHLPDEEMRALADGGPGALRIWEAGEQTPLWARRLLNGARARSLALAPLQHGGKTVGALALLGRTDRPEAWQERSEMVSAFASLAAAALANAQLYRVTEYGAAESTFLLQISQLLASTLQVRRIAQRVAGDASALTSSDICAIYRYDAPADALELIALQGVAPDRVVPSLERLALAELPLTWKAAQEAHPMTSEGLGKGDLLGVLGPAYRMQASLTVPLRARDSILGFLFLARARTPYSHAEVQLGFKLGAIAAMALDNARLYADLAEQMERLRGAQAQLVEAEKMASLGRIVAGVAHELNNPLAVISGYAQMLLDGEVPPGIRGDLERIDRSARRAAQVVRDLLAFARQQPIIARSVDMASLIREVAAVEEPLLAKAGIALDLQLAENLPAVRGDRTQLGSVLSQLIANARQAVCSSQQAGRVTITAGGQETLLLSVSDNGPGIPEDLLDKVFEPFLTTQEVGQGTGMGLAMCYGVIRAHGGRIWASNNPGQGATISIELPAALPQG